MKILYSKKISVLPNYKKQHNMQKDIKFRGELKETQSSLSCSAIYNTPLLYKNSYLTNGLSELVTIPQSLSDKSKNQLDIPKISRLGIPNFYITNYNGIRGESLSSPKNRRFLKPLKNCGVTSIIDLREKYASNQFEELCAANGFNFLKFPINSVGVPDDVVILNMPQLFDYLDKGNYYIACAQGLHRTDIALALNYMFNPKTTEPPYLIGHIRGNQLKTEDITRRLNSVYKNLTENSLNNFGWDKYDEDTFFQRKKEMYLMNKEFFKLT